MSGMLSWARCLRSGPGSALWRRRCFHAVPSTRVRVARCLAPCKTVYNHPAHEADALAVIAGIGSGMAGDGLMQAT